MICYLFFKSQWSIDHTNLEMLFPVINILYDHKWHENWLLACAFFLACTQVGCMEDLGKDSTKLQLTNFTASYKRHPALSPDGKTLCHSTSSPLPGDIKGLSEKAILQPWTDNKQPIPHDGTNFQEHNSFGRNSLEDNSWVFPSPPKSSDTAFGETKNKTSLLPNLPPLHYLDQHNQNCLYKN